MNYYNDNDKFIVKWLKELIKAGLIPPGHVDSRSINEVTPDDIKGYTQKHFFAGIAGWPQALKLAGWNPTKPVWTASLPCQPLSVAGQQKGEKDERHLWPTFFNLVRECRPTVILGEQVASKDGREWLAGIQTDLETLEYRCAAADLPAASVASPHKRNRLFWVAISPCTEGTRQRQQRIDLFGTTGKKLGDSERKGLQERRGKGRVQRKEMESSQGQTAFSPSPTDRLAQSMHTKRGQINEHRENGGNRKDDRRQETCGKSGTCGEVCGFWHNSIAIQCADGKARRIPVRIMANTEDERLQESGQVEGRSSEASSGRRVPAEVEYEIEPALFPLADGFSNRMGTLRGAGNAIVPQVAAVFISAIMDILNEN